MPASLFISEDYVKENTVVDDNVDARIMQSIILDTQEITILKYLGTDLYNKIDADIAASTIAGDYLTLLRQYIKPLHKCLVLEELTLDLTYKYRNKGVLKQSDEKNQTSSIQDLQRLIDRARNKSQVFGDRLIKYLCANTDLFPEYIQNFDSEDEKPLNNAFRTGLYLGNTRTYWSDRDGCCKND